MKSPLSDLKIHFFGTANFARQILAFLDEQKVPLAQVITQTERPAGRKKELLPSPVKIFAQERELPLLQWEKIDSSALEFLKKEKPDLIIVAAYGLIIPQELINLPRFGCLNIHASLLPELRGPSPIQTALWQGLEKTGTTIMLMDEKIDHGSILAQKEIPIAKTDTYRSLEEKIANLSNELLLPTLENWVSQKLQPQQQNHHKATFTKMISKQDGKICWTNTAKQIYQQFQAFYLWPKVYAFWPSTKIQQPERKMTIWEMDYSLEIDFPEKKLGQVFLDGQGQVSIQTEQGIIQPKIVQLEGKKPTDIKSFINGYPDFVGSVLN